MKMQALGLGLGFRPRIALDAHDEDALKMRGNMAKRCCVAQVRTYDFGDSSLHGSLVRSHSADHMKRRKDGSLGLVLPHPLPAILCLLRLLATLADRQHAIAFVTLLRPSFARPPCTRHTSRTSAHTSLVPSRSSPLRLTLTGHDSPVRACCGQLPEDEEEVPLMLALHGSADSDYDAQDSAQAGVAAEALSASLKSRGLEVFVPFPSLFPSLLCPLPFSLLETALSLNFLASNVVPRA